MKKFLFLTRVFALAVVVLLVCDALSIAQTASVSLKPLLYKKKVGLYISKKNFSYTNYYHKIFASFVNKADSLELSEEDFKTAVSIQLGHFLCAKLTQALAPDSVFYINAIPELANKYIANSRGLSLNIDGISSYLPKKTDFIISVDKLDCRTTEKKQLVTFSKYILTDVIVIKSIELNYSLYDVTNRKRIKSSSLTVTDSSPTPPRYINWKDIENAGEKLFSRVLDRILIDGEE